uniref:Endonuclease/exonuclease/phosphatase domain-containing protein n=1 Tax=Megaselia scalaris TaxID=36166 RepID=T1GNJ5_MEGSC
MEFYIFLVFDFNLTFIRGNRYILGGIFNAKHTDWGSEISLTRGKELRQAIRGLGCNFHSSGNSISDFRHKQNTRSN